MNILDIKYCTQDLRFEEEAYKNFETYEQELKTYFLEQPDGYEIFEDLKLRICEMLQSKMKISGNAISTEDIEDIKKSIGHVKQLEEDIEGEEMVEQEPQVTYRDKKLYRSENEKFIGGVCGGLGNYFSIDPLAFRLLFVLVALFSKGIGVIVYAVFWIALQPKVLPVNLTKRLYRNGADKVIAGVCGGLASFFKTEAWIIRVIFLSPLILNVSSGMFNFGFNVFNGSAMGFSIIAYIILWITTKESETATEELLARGEDININSISEESERVHTNPDSNSGFNNLLRVVAFVVIGCALIFIVFMLILLVFGSAFMWPLTNSVLNTGLLKWLGGLSVVFFLILPLVGFVIWAVRRFNGSKSPNKTLRTSFGGLWGLGFASAIAFGFLLYSELRTEATITETVSIPVQGDTLHVSKLQEEFGNGIKVTGLKTLFKNFYRKDNEKQYSKIISFDRKESEDDRFYVEIEKSASGSGNKGAVKNAKLASVENEFVNNEFKIAKYVSLPKDEPFRFQHAKVTFYVPKDKVLDVDPKIKRFKKRKRNIHINADWDDLDKETKEEIEESVEEAMDEVGEALEEIGDAMEEVGVSIEKAGDEIGNVDVKIEKAEKETEAKLRIEKQKLRIKKEQLKLEELQRSIDKSKTLEE